MNGPLEGVRVLDFTQVLAGPYCTQILGDLGADIVKVEPPKGDSTRKWGPPFQGGESSYFLSLNRNKRSIVLDLAKRSGVKVAKELAKKSDVIIENFRPGVMSKFGLSYREIQKLNRTIVYCSISGYGQSGPLRNKPGYDISAYAASGIMSVTGEERGGPVKTGVPIADIGAGLFAALSIAASLLNRKTSKKGCYIDIGLYDSMISWLTFQAGIYFATGKSPKRMGSAHPLLVPYQAFRAHDRFFILAVGSDSLWKQTCIAIGLKDLANEARFASASKRSQNRKELLKILEPRFLTKNASFWLSRLEKAGVPCSSIPSIGEALESSHTRQRGLILSMKHKSAGNISTIASPMHIFPFRSRYKILKRPPPLLGEHTEEILREIRQS
jgi:crotonobetainyl-CoA:carnitine CoA-transferase CaiB-like acyl-CoA transferase